MIKVVQPITISGSSDISWIKYTLTANASCIGITPSSGIITGNNKTLNFEFLFSDQECILNPITLNLESDTNCSNSIAFYVTNPCDAITVQIVNNFDSGNPLAFSAIVAGATQPYTVDWQYDTGLLEPLEEGDALKLQIRDGVVIPPNTMIIADVTDYNNCKATAIFFYQFQAPTALNSSSNVNCIPDTIIDGKEVAGQSGVITLQAETPAGTELDFDTVEFINPYSDLFLKRLSPDRIQAYSQVRAVTGSKSIQWSVKNTLGIRSNYASINFVVPSCNVTTEIFFNNEIVKLTPAQAQVAQIIYIDIEDNIIGDPDWDTFTFKAGTGQTLNSATSLTTQNGTVELTTGRRLKYTVTSLTLPIDPIMMTIENTDGVLSNTGTVSVDFEAEAAPVLAAQAVDVATGSNITIDLLAGATGSPKANTIIITDAPDNGSYVLGTDGTLIYTPSVNEADTDSISYKVANYDGTFSAEQTTTINIIHAGLSPIKNLCLPAASYNLVTQLGSGVTPGGSWTADGSNPSVVSLVDPTDVDFSTADDGVYKFTYEVTVGTATDTATVTVNLGTYELTHLQTIVTPEVGPDEYTLTGRFQVDPAAVPFSNLKIYLHKGASPLTPDSSNIIDVKSPTSYDSGTGIFELDYPITYNDTDVLVFRAEVRTPCALSVFANGDEMLGV